MSYAKKTFSDSNPVKRFFQNSRLKDALRLAGSEPGLIVDFGAGNGELCKHLARRFPRAEIVCYEPHPELLEQAGENLSGLANVSLTAEPPALPADLLFCLEVFEHLPERETDLVIRQLSAALGADGTAIIGVPVEVGIPAIYKGLFRMVRRFGEHDARAGHILSAALGRPPAVRPSVELLPGSYYHLHHLGFDHRSFRKRLNRDFAIVKTHASPFAWFGAAVNSELHFVVSKRKDKV